MRKSGLLPKKRNSLVEDGSHLRGERAAGGNLTSGKNVPSRTQAVGPREKRAPGRDGPPISPSGAPRTLQTGRGMINTQANRNSGGECGASQMRCFRAYQQRARGKA